MLPSFIAMVMEATPPFRKYTSRIGSSWRWNTCLALTETVRKWGRSCLKSASGRHASSRFCGLGVLGGELSGRPRFGMATPDSEGLRESGAWPIRGGSKLGKARGALYHANARATWTDCYTARAFLRRSPPRPLLARVSSTVVVSSDLPSGSGAYAEYRFSVM